MASLILGVAAAAACNDKPAAPAASRVDSVAADPKQGPSTEGFCDVRAPAERAPAFQFPALAGAAPPAATGWRWINVWATWCKPCLEELPRLHRWKDRLSAAGRKLDLAFVSVDESDDVVAAFRKAHPEAPDSARLADPAGLPAWLKALGLDEGAPIPIHVFVDPSGHTRCVRAGGVGEADYELVERVVTGS